MLERQMQEMRDLPERVTSLELQMLQLREETRNEVSSIRREFTAADEETRVLKRILHEDAMARIKACEKGMTRTAKSDEVLPPRRPSQEEMKEVFERLRAWGPEGERIVEVHEKMIALLEDMIERRRKRPGR
jgi:hypothetical protein